VVGAQDWSLVGPRLRQSGKLRHVVRQTGFQRMMDPSKGGTGSVGSQGVVPGRRVL